jgi:hypothetical protein
MDTTRGPENIRAKHRDIKAIVDMVKRKTRFEQGLLERKGAADYETHEIGAPIAAHIGWLVNKLAAVPDPVTRQIGPKVEIVAERGHGPSAGLAGPDNRTRLGITLREPQKIAGQLLRQNDEIALNIARGKAGRRAGDFPSAAGQPHVEGDGKLLPHRNIHETLSPRYPLLSIGSRALAKAGPAVLQLFAIA